MPVERIEPYEEGGDIKDRIDEIVASGVDVHLEMVEEDAAWMQIGESRFLIFVSKGNLHVVLK